MLLTPVPSGLSVCARESCIDRAAYLSIIRGERRGLLAALLRGGLRAASWTFAIGVAARSGLYRAGLLGETRAALPVISIGNLTAGGTGKTPLTIALARRLVEKGEKPAVLARGYGAERDGELNEELELVKRAVPQARVYAGADRVASAERAASEGATVILLDDGFQHRRLARDLDVVVIDATDPWGEGFLLPRGLLREPISAASRADAIVLSRVEQAPDKVASIRSELGAVTEAPIASMRFEPANLRALGGEAVPLERLRGANVVLLSAIGNPRAFQRTVESLGAKVAFTVAHPDHHRFTTEEIAVALRAARETGSLAVLTTEKDAVKIPVTEGVWSLGVEARLEEAEPLLARIDRVLTEHRNHAPGRAPRAVLAGGAP